MADFYFNKVTTIALCAQVKVMADLFKFLIESQIIILDI